jgi:hypothetical protein
MYFLRLSQSGVSISIYNIKYPVFLMETLRVPCDMRT